MRFQVQNQLDELAVQLANVSQDRDEAQSRANDLEQRLNSALEVQATRQASENSEATSTLPDVRPTANPEEFTPENFIWVKQQWDRVAKENLKMDNSLYIAGVEKHRLEAENIRLSRVIENYQKRKMGHGRSMNDAAQQTENESPRIATVATQTDFMDQISLQNTANKPIEPEHQAVPPQQPRIVMTDAAIQAVEQHDENILLDELPDQTIKDSGALEVTIQELTGDKERLEKQLEVCIKQNASGRDSSTQTEGTRASRTDHENRLADKSENNVNRQENTERRSALEQPQNEDSPPEEPESQVSDANPEEAQIRSTDPGVEVQGADVEMGGITTGQDSPAPQDIAMENDAPAMPATPPARLETEVILRFDLQWHLNSISRDSRTNSDDARRRRDSRRPERQRRREQRRLEREEEAQRPRKHRDRSYEVYTQKKKTLWPLGWVRYRRRTLMDFFSFSYMFSRRLSYRSRCI
ncbi:hypothetical protein NOF04DRAFT_14379 [Fusarium oxysporum II5]|uniref:Uncharacterized protein n=1 Tax=Fusarium odoratissimum (strain NRRL 54006) TaxID=1089451 RepID=X0IVL5_FUSO5|nr:uncharacterized protein FOIG_14149 [Fusarium odoratissimum NRRL 54006]EXL92983.1 hypothetical protein FOIG_14149 [Fusarium odoratissimum NRRL 54006]KAK2123196.1 hypothetical protein NOF04DRAFT_14379 [Fusarium oxysporum II5]